MSIDTIKQEIEQYSNAFSEKTADLQNDRVALVNALKPFIKEKLKDTVESAVKSNPEHTKELGAQTLGDMKKQLSALLDSSDALVDDAFSDNNLWVHINYTVLLSGDTWGQKHNNTKKAENCIISGIKAVLGKAGKILVDNGYAKAGSQYERTSQWQINDKSEIVYGSNYGFQIPKELETQIENYCKKIEPLHDDAEKIERLKKELSEQEAVDLWEQV